MQLLHVTEMKLSRKGLAKMFLYLFKSSGVFSSAITLAYMWRIMMCNVLSYFWQFNLRTEWKGIITRLYDMLSPLEMEGEKCYNIFLVISTYDL